ncbi:hypothetical protein QQ045_008267 [Rhodiola kirilowii]
MNDLVNNLFPDDIGHNHHPSPSAPPESLQQLIIKLPGAILHLIDKHYSVQLASGDFTVTSLTQGGNVIAVLARVGDEIQWPLTKKDQAAVKLDESHYFFSFCAPSQDDPAEDVLSYGLTFACKGQEFLLNELDRVLDYYSNFSVQRVVDKGDRSAVLEVTMAMEMSPNELNSDKEQRELMEKKCAAYWTTLAPNVEDYSGTAAKLIASGSGQLIKGILWCGDVTIDRLKWGNEVMLKRMSSKSKSEVSPETLKRIKRVKRMTKMTEKVANGVLSGVVKVSGFVSSSVANSKVGKKFFGLLPGEIVLASLDGFSKVCDAVEVAGKNVMSTSSTVTTGLVSERYGEEAGKATNESLDAAGHAIGTAWAVFKIRKALNPKSVIKPSTLAKSAAKGAAAEAKAKKGSK